MITSYGHVITMAAAAAVDAPITVMTLIQSSKTRVSTSHIAQPDRSTPGQMYVTEYMSHIPVRQNRHS